MAWDMKKWRAVVDTVMTIWVLENVVKLLIAEKRLAPSANSA
jgi:hypothetical protein